MTLHPALQTIFDMIDTIVELYLRTLIRPFLKFHDVLYANLNKFIRSQLDSHHVPAWFTANFITYYRTFLIIPTIIVLGWGWWPVASFLIVFVDFGDFLDGVVARYWVDERKKEKEKAEELALKKNDEYERQKSAVDSDDDGFELISIGRPQTIPSWKTVSRSKSYGGFVDAVCDKVYVVPCWITFLSLIVPTTAGDVGVVRTVQYVVLWCLICAEAASGTVRFRAYFTAGGVPAPKVVGLDFSTSAVKADGIGKAKQTLEMVGSALYVLPYVRYVGLLLLAAAVPLAYESVRRKIKKRVVYVDYHGSPTEELSHRTLRFWMQARGMGSKLVVGVRGGGKDDNDTARTDMVLNACACSAVDEVIADAPERIGLDFMNEHGIDYVVVSVGGGAGGGSAGSGLAEDDVMGERRCLAISTDGTARPLEAKAAAKTE